MHCRIIKGALIKYRGYVRSTSIPSGREVIPNIVFSRFMLQNNAFEKGQLYLLGIITCGVKGRLIAACFPLEIEERSTGRWFQTRKDWREFLFHTVSPVGTYAVRKRLLVPRGKRYPINLQHLHFIS